MRIRLETEHLSLGIVVLDGVTIREEYLPLPVPEPEGDVQVTRKMYRAIRQDPTRNRPSSEALLRRVKKGLGLPRINSLVDAVNVCSLRLLLPFGCYDLAKTRGDLVVGLGAEGESYEGVGNRRVNVAGRYRVRDDDGPFGNPTMDSLRTRITPDTERALIVIFSPPDHDHAALPSVAETLSAAAARATTHILRHGESSDIGA